MRRDLCSKMYALDPACHKNEGDDDQGASLSAAGGSLIHRGRSGVGRQLTYPTPGSDETEGDGVEQTGRGSYMSVCLFQSVCLFVSVSQSVWLSVCEKRMERCHGDYCGLGGVGVGRRGDLSLFSSCVENRALRLKTDRSVCQSINQSINQSNAMTSIAPFTCCHLLISVWNYVGWAQRLRTRLPLATLFYLYEKYI